MSSYELFVKSLLFYFLPKLSLFLPLCWMAVCLWFSEPSHEESEAPETPELRDDANEQISSNSNSWYDSVAGSSAESKRRLPSGWL